MHPTISPPQLVCLLLLLSTHICIAGSIICYCDATPVLGLPPPECFFNDAVCTSTRGCYLRRVYSHEYNAFGQAWGCISDEHSVHEQIDYVTIFCGQWDTPTDAYKCCNATDMCNRDLHITLQIETASPSPSAVQSVSPTTGKRRGVNTLLISAVTVTITVSLLCLFGLLLPIIFIVKQRRRHLLTSEAIHFPPAPGSLSQHWTHDLEVAELSKTSEGERTSSLPYQVLTDIKDIVKLNYQIEIGRFGIFYHGYYDGVEVVLKRFLEGNRSAWLRESLMYNNVLQSHENVLAFFASAMTGSDSGDGSDLWLVTKYHEYGSLQDYLRQHTVTAKVILQMAASSCSGLAHLHSESSGNQLKIPVAHCHLTSRNILVKENLSCCIGDFRLAVFKHKNEVHLPEDAKMDTVRYMAPEMLSEPVSVMSFETFKQADVYALGLVLWEVCQRAGCYGEAYQVPFQGLVPPDPSLEDMQRLVVMEKAQPSIPNKWNYNKLLHEMVKIMHECWYYTSSARPTAVYLKKKLLKMSREFENMDFAADEVTLPSKEACKDTQCGNVYVSTL